MSKLKIGDTVIKPKGYSFDGEVRAVFTTKSGEIRVVAELKPGNGGGMLHIFSEGQLEIWPPAVTDQGSLISPTYER